MLASQPQFDEPLAPRESLLYIRRTLDAAGRLSSISGSGMVWLGILALVAVLVNYAVTGAPWETRALLLPSLAVWAVLLVLSGAITVAAMAAKTRRAGQPFWSPVLRKALWSLSAPMTCGAILSAALLSHGTAALLPLAWLACYGAALTSAGVVSVSPVRWMGISFLALALASLLIPTASGLAILAIGFGGLHITFGGYIFLRHDG